MTMGGVARNIAETLARLGQDTILITAVGDDDYGTLLASSAAEVGIDTSHFLLVPGAHSGSYLALIDHDGQMRHGLSDLSVATAITPDYILARADLFDEIGLVVMDMNLPPATIDTVFELARSAGVPVAADPTSRALAERLRPHMADLFFLAANATETEALCGQVVLPNDNNSAIRAAQCLLGFGVGQAAVTMAEFGVGFANASTSGHIPALRTRVVKQTGAGDSFAGTTLFALLNDIPFEEALQLGVTAAALTLQSEYTVLPNLSLDLLYNHLQ